MIKDAGFRPINRVSDSILSSDFGGRMNGAMPGLCTLLAGEALLIFEETLRTGSNSTPLGYLGLDIMVSGIFVAVGAGETYRRIESDREALSKLQIFITPNSNIRFKISRSNKMMKEIKIVGTSHVSEDSIKEIKKAVDGFNPDCIAIELDEIRLSGMMSGKRGRPNGLLGFVLYMAQKHVGGSLGVMPGQEMLFAAKLSKEKEIPLALIDRDIRLTMKDMSSIPIGEKMKLILGIFGIFSPKKPIDIRKVPSDETIDELLEYMKEGLPNLYKALIGKRDAHMAGRLMSLFSAHDRVLAVMGAGHKRGVKRILDRGGIVSFSVEGYDIVSC